MNIAMTPAMNPARTPTARLSSAIAALERLPYSAFAVVARAATATVFWRSGTTKISDWDATLSLFADDYKVPLLPPELAAYMATALELGCSVLIALGLLTRVSALLLTGMTAVIEIFVYPNAWPTHILWLTAMLPLIARGGGVLSLDHLVWRFWAQRLG